jgi:site-specific recombinase XerD
MSTPSKVQRVNAMVHPQFWPALDQAAWNGVIRGSRSPFRKDGGGTNRSPYTVTKVANGYGRFISYITHFHHNLLSAPPCERLTTDVLDGYFEHMGEMHYADNTIVCYFDDLQKAMTWMHPGQDFQFVTMPQGSPLASLLPMACKNTPVPHTVVFLACARQSFNAGLAETNRSRRKRFIRDAALLGILATAAPRIETLWQLQIPRHLRRVGDEWWLEFTPDILKTGRQSGRSLEVPVEPEVGGWLTRYIESERPEMLNGQQHRSLWVTTTGKPMVKGSISGRMRVLTERLLGTAYGTHACRTALATTEAIEGSVNPLDSSLILGHSSPQMTRAHYNRANAMSAGQRHAKRLKLMLKSLEKATRR